MRGPIQMLVDFRDFWPPVQPDFVMLADANLWTQFFRKEQPGI